MQIECDILSPEHPAQTLTLTHPVIRQWCFAREMFRRLGFESKDLYITISRAADRQGVVVPSRAVIGVCLRAQDRELDWAIGWVDATAEQVAAYYEVLVDEWNSNQMHWSVDGFMEEFTSSWAFDKRWILMNALKECGFSMPDGAAP